MKNKRRSKKTGVKKRIVRRSAGLISRNDCDKITGLKLYEDSQKYRTLFETANDAIFIMDGPKFIQCNNKTLEIFGAAKSDIIGSSPVKFSPIKQPDGIASVIKAKTLINKALAGEPQAFEWKHKKADGRLFDAEVRLNSFKAGKRKFLQAIVRDVSKHRLNETRLKAVEERYNLLAENINDSIWMLDMDFRYLYASPSTEKLSGFKPAELLGKSVFDVIDPAAIAEAKSMIGRYVPMVLKRSDFKLPPFEMAIKRKNGLLLQAEISISAFWDGKGGLAGYVGISRDISERKKLQRALEESEKYFRAITDGISDFILVYSGEGKVKYASKSYARLVGSEVQDVMGKSLAERIVPEERGKVAELLKLFVEGRMHMGNGIIAHIKKNDGTIIPVEVLARNLLSDPVINGIVINGRDISERVEREQKIKDSEKYYRSMIEGQSDVIMVIDRDGIVRYASPSYEKLMGLKPETIIGKPLGSNTADPRQREENFRKFTGYAEESSDKPSTIEIEVTNPAGKKNILKVTTKNMLSDPVINGYLCNINVITEVRESERKLAVIVKELQLLNEDLEHFAYASYHDLQEPLRNVSLSIQYLESKLGLKTDQDTVFYINEAVEGAARMKAMLSDILKYTKAGRSNEGAEIVDMNALLDEVKDTMRPVINSNNVELICGVLPRVKAIRTLIVQVLQNLISNAVKYNKNPKPRVEISCEAKGREWIFAVRDNGIGIENMYLDKIFVMFERLYTRQEYPGTGLGLALCRKIIERHNGRIWAESEPGRGSVFYFALPA